MTPSFIGFLHRVLGIEMETSISGHGSGKKSTTKNKRCVLRQEQTASLCSYIQYKCKHTSVYKTIHACTYTMYLYVQYMRKYSPYIQYMSIPIYVYIRTYVHTIALTTAVYIHWHTHLYGVQSLPVHPDGYGVQSLSVHPDGYGVQPLPVHPDGYGVQPLPVHPDGYGVQPLPVHPDGYGVQPLPVHPDGYGVQPLPVHPDGYGVQSLSVHHIYRECRVRGVYSTFSDMYMW